MKTFLSTASMALATLTAGQFVQTQGHTTAGDGGGATYLIKTAAAFGGTPDGFGDHVLANGNVAVLQIDVWSVSTRYGAINNAVGNVAAIHAARDAGNVMLPKGNPYGVSASLEYKSEKAISGEFYGFGGSVLVPDGNFPSLIGDTGASAWTRFMIRDLLINAAANTSVYALLIDSSFLAEIERVWIKDGFKGVSVINSDSITFRDVKIMEDTRDEAVFIGDNSRSIRFITSNFESGDLGRITGSFRIEGFGTTKSSAELHGCQFERAALLVNSGSVKMYGGKVSDGEIFMGQKSLRSRVETDTYGSTVIHDFGFNNEVIRPACQNMATPLHKWPALPMTTATTTSPTYGAAGDEYVFLVSGGSFSSAAVTSGVIEVKEGVTVLDTSETFNIVSQGSSIGLAEKNSHTHLSVVRSVAAAIGPVTTNCQIFGVKGGKSLLANSTFDAGTATGWTTVDVTPSASGTDVLLTPTNATWAIYQNFSGLIEQGKKYIAVAKFTGSASLVYGNAWDGSPGSRPLSSAGIANLYGDGDAVAMLSFEHYGGIAARLSFGSVTSSDPVTVKWIALIEA